MSAPHTYATDRLSLVLSGTWWVNSGADIDPDSTVPVPAGGFVRRIARTPHYDGVKKNANEPAIIGLFGIAPVQFELVDPGKPGWRKLRRTATSTPGPHELEAACGALNDETWNRLRDTGNG